MIEAKSDVPDPTATSMLDAPQDENLGTPELWNATWYSQGATPGGDYSVESQTGLSETRPDTTGPMKSSRKNPDEIDPVKSSRENPEKTDWTATAKKGSAPFRRTSSTPRTYPSLPRTPTEIESSAASKTELTPSSGDHDRISSQKAVSTTESSHVTAPLVDGLYIAIPDKISRPADLSSTDKLQNSDDILDSHDGQCFSGNKSHRDKLLSRKWRESQHWPRRKTLEVK